MEMGMVDAGKEVAWTSAECWEGWEAELELDGDKDVECK